MLTPAHQIVAVVWAIVAAFVGLKGIKYVASIASFLPLIPFVILVILFIKTAGGLATFDGQATVQSAIAAAEEQTGAAGLIRKPLRRKTAKRKKLRRLMLWRNGLRRS